MKIYPKAWIFLLGRREDKGLRGAKGGHKGVNAHELIRWCRERLAPYKVPKYIEFRDMLSKSKVGKLLRRELRAQERKKRQGL